MNLKSGYPFWLIQDGLPFSYPKIERSVQADVIILGGGISGALAAYHLGEAGIKCIVVDARSIGLGSTCASTSLLQYEIDTALVDLRDKVGTANAVRAYKLCEESIFQLQKIARKIHFSDFEMKPSLYFAAGKKDIPFLEKEFEIRKQNGFDVTYLEGAQVKAKFGFAAPAAILSASGAQTNAYMFTHALHQYSEKNGVKVFSRTPVKKIIHQKDKVKLYTESGFVLTAGTLVYATGYESVKYIDEKIVDLHSTYAIISEQEKDYRKLFKRDALLWNTADPYLYMRTTSDDRILLGGRDDDFYDPGRRDKLLPYKVRGLENDFKKLFPGLPFKAEFSWAGTFGATKDGLPFIGPYKKLPNSFFALGFGGNGITFSLIAARLLTAMLKGKENKDAAVFSFERTNH